jgi:hypothetical protein
MMTVTATISSHCHCEEPKATRQSPSAEDSLAGDCRVAALLAMTRAGAEE